MKRKSITIYDIAKEAGVSSATVSRVIAGNYPVSAKTRKKVLGLIDKYDYQPNAVARSLTKKETKMIGFVLPDITNPFFSQVFIEAEKYALTKGYTLILCNSMNSSEMESKYLRLLSERQVEGIILMGGRINKKFPDAVEVSEVSQVLDKLPVMMINGKIDGLHCHSVRTDEAKGMELAVNHLVRQGHKKIGLIGGVKGITTTDIKVEAYRNLLSKYDLTIRESWQIYSGFDVQTGEEAIDKLLMLNKDKLPTALIGINDLVIIGALKACRRKRMKPFDFVGFDNTDLAKNSSPEITSVSHPYNELGKKAIDLLINASKSSNESKDILLDPYLEVRESCSITKL
ncbi:LacI family DNA-binding transcriptional regulator [Gracilibacillus salitolerans]|uniref:LacI family DNA-binding transcriptional regulator n=1 Tax=Gracilibacillus salitolerans TaxID=2663022 RepID=A0A5Q2TPJ3_9BACI|nr:LacI family DNA-binding transcriptional regulator [Gracilibacillus salitolerans]QGH35963.1 LacI family DNA-binding transcriptional regulator [Gracilibacillus salitolerans]